MEGEAMLQKRCDNDNHRRSVVTVRFCASCGVVVNGNISASRCPEDDHARARRARNIYCIGCGERLVLAR
jgi:hypothetical protein